MLDTNIFFLFIFTWQTKLKSVLVCLLVFASDPAGWNQVKTVQLFVLLDELQIDFWTGWSKSVHNNNTQKKSIFIHRDTRKKYCIALIEFPSLAWGEKAANCSSKPTFCCLSFRNRTLLTLTFSYPPLWINRRTKKERKEIRTMSVLLTLSCFKLLHLSRFWKAENSVCISGWRAWVWEAFFV